MWNEADKLKWFKEQKIQRSYLEQVVVKIKALAPKFEIIPYGALDMSPERYPLFLLKSKTQNPKNKTVLVTGGVHGYETSGVHGALKFCEQWNGEGFNLVCAPCISPWAYETINRWNPKAIDPNRSFKADSPAEECALFLKAMSDHQIKPFVHFDLHETTDTDETVFRPALEQRDGIEQPFSEIPDGFYVVGDSKNPQAGFQKAIIDSVRKVTHIAPADENGCIIGDPLAQEGVVNYDGKKKFLCAQFSDAEYTTTTEVYPDSPKATPAICIEAQVAAVQGGLAYVASAQ